MAIGKKKRAEAEAAVVAVVSHHRCFSSSGLASLYGAFRCKQFNLGDVVIPEAINTRQQQQEELKNREQQQQQQQNQKCQQPQQQQIQQALIKDASIGKEDVEGVRRRMRAVAEMQAMVRALQCGDADKSSAAATAVRAATRRDSGARATLALMGAIPPLVAMLDSPRIATNVAALLALLNLAVRNDQNKAAIVHSGAIAKILRLLSQSGGSASMDAAAAAALLSLSALDANKLAIGGADGAVAALAKIASCSGGMQARRDALGAIYNLSIHPANAAALASGGAVAALLSGVYEPELSWRAVATAANLAATPRGRRALARSPASSLVFLDVLSATAATLSGAASVDRGATSQRQDSAAYVVAAMAECSPAQRRALLRGGAASVLLETVLLGSPAAQECASKALGCLRDEECGVGGSCEEFLLLTDDDDERCLVEMELVSEERQAVNRLVQQSLKMNMDRIVQRACIPFAPHLNSSSSPQQQSPAAAAAAGVV